MKVAVVGAGSWGTAFANMLASSGHDVVIWARRKEVVAEIDDAHTNEAYLPELTLAFDLRATDDLALAVSGAQAVVLAVPSVALRKTAQELASALNEDTPVVVLSKGVERETSNLMLDILFEEFGNKERLAVLSGPNHAEEVSRKIPSATVVAAYNEDTAKFFQNLCNTSSFRVYTSCDVVGVELCAATKNIIAIACGMSDGLGFGDNTKATIITRGLAEISRLVQAMDGNSFTCMGLAGVGDLIATCTSRHSRNRLFGEMIAKGHTLSDFTNETHMVAEGYYASASVFELAERNGIEMPITQCVYRILYKDVDLQSELEGLMLRSVKSELS